MIHNLSSAVFKLTDQPYPQTVQFSLRFHNSCLCDPWGTEKHQDIRSPARGLNQRLPQKWTTGHYTVIFNESKSVSFCTSCTNQGSRYSDWLRAGRPRVRSSSSGRVKIFLLSTASRRLWGPPSFLSNGYRGSFPWGKNAWALSWPLNSN
jgi:hypothetical protein